MEQQIRGRFKETILREAMRRYGITDDQIRPLNAFEGFIYEFERQARPFILRIGHSLRRSEALIQGEVDWINYLAGHGVSVARAVPSESGNLVEAVEDGLGGQFLATAFIKAKGRRPWEAGWTPAGYEAYGQLLGSMHALAQSYRPGDPAWKRPEWDSDIFEFVERYLPDSEYVAKTRYRALCNHLRTLPKESTSYGLIHQDAHEGNLLVDETGRLTLFDFDDCLYSWYTNDVAIVLFYIAMDAEDPANFTRQFMAHFLRGYRTKHRLAPHWLQVIPDFLKLRELELYAVIHRDFEVNNIDNAWCARFMRGRRERIEQGVPYIDLDFSSLSAYL